MSSRGRSARRGRRGITSVRFPGEPNGYRTPNNDDPWSSRDFEYSPNNIPELEHPHIVPGANLQRTNNGPIKWSVYDFFTVETVP